MTVQAGARLSLRPFVSPTRRFVSAPIPGDPDKPSASPLSTHRRSRTASTRATKEPPQALFGLQDCAFRSVFLAISRYVAAPRKVSVAEPVNCMVEGSGAVSVLHWQQSAVDVETGWCKG